MRARARVHMFVRMCVRLCTRACLYVRACACTCQGEKLRAAWRSRKPRAGMSCAKLCLGRFHKEKSVTLKPCLLKDTHHASQNQDNKKKQPTWSPRVKGLNPSPAAPPPLPAAAPPTAARTAPLYLCIVYACLRKTAKDRKNRREDDEQGREEKDREGCRESQQLHRYRRGICGSKSTFPPRA
jgi:hypothetical protein